MIRLIIIVLLISGYSTAEYSDALGRQLIYPLAVDAYNPSVKDCINATLGDHDVSKICYLSIKSY